MDTSYHDSIPPHRLEALFEGLHLQLNAKRIIAINEAWIKASDEARSYFKLHVHFHGTYMRPAKAFVGSGTRHREKTSLRIGRGTDSNGHFHPVPGKQFDVWLTWNRKDFLGA